MCFLLKTDGLLDLYDSIVAFADVRVDGYLIKRLLLTLG